MDVSLWTWSAVLAVIAGMLAVDLLAHRREHVISLREAATWSAVWVSLGVAFGGVIWWAYGAQAGGEYFAGFLIEKSLAVDNIFVFALIFSYFAVPRQYQHWVLFFGVLGALVFRAVFIAAGAALIGQFQWVLYLFGAFLVFTSNAFAILGLRSLYFLLADLMHRFIYLKEGLSAILVFVGTKMLLLDVVKIPIAVSLAVIISCLAVAIVASLRATRADSEPAGAPDGPDATGAGH